MISDAGSTRGPTRFRCGLILAFTLFLGLGVAVSHQSALAGVDGAREANGASALATDARSSGVIVVAEKDHDGDKNGNKGNKNWSKNNRDRGDNGHKNWSKNGNGNKGNKNWSKDDNGDWNDGGDRNWSENDGNWDDNGNKNWGKNNNNWGNYNNNWNKNWDRRAYVRNWSRQPYYGDFIGGVILGSILAANGVGMVPLAPEPYLCWYWADPYMYRGYWDYCY